MSQRRMNARPVHLVAAAEQRSGPPVAVRAQPSEAHELAGLVADSFFDLAPSRWLVNDPGERATVLRDYFEIEIRHAFDYGHVATFADRAGVLVVIDMTKALPEPDEYEARRLAACGRYTENFVFLEGEFERHFPREKFSYLPLLAVYGYAQGRGLGTALLDDYHRDLDTAGTLSYLEAPSERHVRFYERHGYRAGEPFYLPSDGPPFWPMTRTPQPVDDPGLPARQRGSAARAQVRPAPA
jgi:ribosomal protein S18 acetylase RimI-like enzyme